MITILCILYLGFTIYVHQKLLARDKKTAIVGSIAIVAFNFIGFAAVDYYKIAQIFWFGSLGFFFSMVIFIARYILKQREIFNNFRTNPCDENVDMVMNFMENTMIINNPQEWNKMRGIWYTANNSPKITTAKKQELLTFLLTKGVNIAGHESVIIDNYEGNNIVVDPPVIGLQDVSGEEAEEYIDL